MAETQHDHDNNKRATRRFALRLPVSVRYAENEPEHSAQTRDVSARGICFYVDSAIQAGSAIDFTLTLPPEMLGDALDFLLEGALLQIRKYNGNPIGLQLPLSVELAVTYTEPAVKGDTSSGSVTKDATLETGRVIRVPLFVKEGDKINVTTETGEFSGRA